MKTMTGNILDGILLSKADAVCITTNGMVNSQGFAVMGAGVALSAKIRWPELPNNLGIFLQREGNKVHILTGEVRSSTSTLYVLSFPTKHDWKDPSDINLITKSCLELRELADKKGWKDILLPPPGCGMGGLRWHDVKQVIEPMLDDRFTVVFLKKS